MQAEEDQHRYSAECAEAKELKRAAREAKDKERETKKKEKESKKVGAESKKGKGSQASLVASRM